MNQTQRKELIDTLAKQAKGLRSHSDVVKLVRQSLPYASDPKIYGITNSVIVIAKLDLEN